MPNIHITTPPPPNRIVKITTSKPQDNAHDSSYYSSQRFGGNGNLVLGEYEYNPLVSGYDPRWSGAHQSDHDKTLSDFVQNAYVGRLKGGFNQHVPNHGQANHAQANHAQAHHGITPQSNNFPKKIVISTGSLSGGALPFVVSEVRGGQQGQVQNHVQQVHVPQQQVQQVHQFDSNDKRPG